MASFAKTLAAPEREFLGILLALAEAAQLAADRERTADQKSGARAKYNDVMEEAEASMHSGLIKGVGASFADGWPPRVRMAVAGAAGSSAQPATAASGVGGGSQELDVKPMPQPAQVQLFLHALRSASPRKGGPDTER